MRAYGARLPIVLGAMATVLALLFGLQFLYARQAVVLPLSAQLRQTPGVSGRPVVHQSGGTLRIRVQLRQVPDLRSTYRHLQSVVRAAAGGRAVSLRVQDSATAALRADFYQKLNFIIDQGRATGQYVAMQKAFAAASRHLGLSKAQLTVGEAHVYVALTQGSHDLYEILPLRLPAATGAGGGRP